MANDKFDEYDETAANNTVVGGVPIEGSSAISYFDNAIREHMSHHAEWNDWVDVASASTANLGAVPDRYIRITGTTTITGLGTVKEGTRKDVVFAGALTLTHNATSLILPGGANITTAAGDCAAFMSEGSGNWRCLVYSYAAGGLTASSTATLTNKTIDGDDNTLQDIGTASLKTKTGADAAVVTGTAGTDTYTARWNADGDLVDGYPLLDEDDMASDSATSLASQQSIKAYVDGQAGVPSAVTAGNNRCWQAGYNSSGYYLFDGKDGVYIDVMMLSGGTVRVGYDLDDDGGGVPVFTIYRNGSSVFTTSGTTAATTDVSSISAGDILRFQLFNGSTAHTLRYVWIGIAESPFPIAVTGKVVTQ